MACISWHACSIFLFSKFCLFQCVFNVVKDVGLVLEEMAEGETLDSIKEATSASFEVRITIDITQCLVLLSACITALIVNNEQGKIPAAPR